MVRCTSKKNNSIEALRFFFICIICLWHCGVLAPWLHHGYIAVEFYFILSGFFIHQSFVRHSNLGVCDFTIKKVKRFFPPYFISVMLLMLLDRKQYFYISDFSADGILSVYFKHLHEFFFCQCMGLTDVVAINHPLWFLSILIFGGAILYGMLCSFYKQSTSLFLPAICIFGFSFLLSNGNCQLQNQMNLYGLQSWMIRGLSEMSLGIMISVFFIKKRQSIIGRTKILNVMSIVALVGMFLMAIAHGNYDYLALFLVPILIITCVTENSLFDLIFKSDIWDYLGGLSMYMYFIHLFVASLYWIFCSHPLIKDIPNSIIAILYLCVVVISAQSLKFISSKIRN